MLTLAILPRLLLPPLLTLAHKTLLKPAPAA
jgi:hypothetical protein